MYGMRRTGMVLRNIEENDEKDDERDRGRRRAAPRQPDKEDREKKPASGRRGSEVTAMHTQSSLGKTAGRGTKFPRGGQVRRTRQVPPWLLLPLVVLLVVPISLSLLSSLSSASSSSLGGGVAPGVTAPYRLISAALKALSPAGF